MNRLDACYFGPDRNGYWGRLARVLRYTAAQHCPAWQRRIIQIPLTPMRIAFGLPTQRANTDKLLYWNRQVQEAPPGDQILLMDADAMILRPLDDVWTRDFDLAYTVRQELLPFNAGVIFLRVSHRTKAFMQGWADENVRLLQNAKQPWRKQFGGVNQASFAAVLDAASDLRIQTLPCAEWNCEDTSWRAFDPSITRIVHVKSQLRRACLYDQDITPELKPLIALWHELDAVAGREAVSA